MKRWKGLIVIGYQGIGKSSCAGTNLCVDLESSLFSTNGKKMENWHIPYCNMAMHIADQGYTVFTSSHKAVYEQFKSMNRLPNVGNIVVFCPDSRYKNEWVQRLQERYDRTGLDKDFRALMNAKDRYVENIYELVNCGLPVVQPAYFDYDLMNYVHAMRFKWCMASAEDGKT